MEELGSLDHFEARLSKPVKDWLIKITPERMTPIEMAAAIVTDAFFDEEDASVPEKLPFLIGRMRGKYDMQKVRNLFSAIENHLSISYKDIIAYNRNARFIDARLIAARILREEIKMSLPDIGKVMCRDHTTIFQHINSSERRIMGHPPLHHKYVTVLKEAGLING